MKKSYRKLISTSLLICSSVFLYATYSCSPPDCSSVDRFLDNNDGTVTDCRTDLIWLKNANCFDQEPFLDAVYSAKGINNGECGLTDGSATGDWHLPTKEELQGIGTDPPTTWYLGDNEVNWIKPSAPFINVAFDSFDYYWVIDPYDNENAWSVNMLSGWTMLLGKSGYFHVWPVKK